MRIIKLAIISFIFLFLLITIISLFIPSHVRISKAININAEKDSLFAFIADTGKWYLWHPAYQQTAAKTLQNRITITPLITNDSLVVMQLNLPGKKSLNSSWQVYHHRDTDSLTLQWYLDFNLKWYPWQKFSSLLYEERYGTMMQNGLTNLREITEHPPSHLINSYKR